MTITPEMQQIYHQLRNETNVTKRAELWARFLKLAGRK